MKVLAIIGSPRKGNTTKVVQQIERELKNQREDICFEYLFLKDTNLKLCKGCFACIAKGEHFCPIKDDLLIVTEKMFNADGIIFASPVYVFNVSTLMKNLIDRLAYMSHRPQFFGKSAMAVVTSGGGGIPETLKYLESVLHGWGFRFAGKLGIMMHPVVDHSQKISNIKKIAYKFYDSFKDNKQISPRLSELLQFRIIKLNSVKFKEHFPADYEFYKDTKDYYIQTRIKFFKNIYTKILEKIIVRSMEKSS
ncbi:MAG: hypothetical protein APF76_16285 [Desulfitibacter sp. BRH_c19]|nr:MAG: hypothetical protein APF76_16285 [Desulfitibacter sp. BRH_c19]